MSILIDHVSKSYGTTRIIDNISLEIEHGELFVLLGASGSGKSTLLRMIAGLIPVDSGRIALHGRDVTHLPPQERNTGFVFQNYSLFRHMTIAQNIEFALSIRHVDRATRAKRVEELLELIGLPGLGNRTPGQLSGGQQQRVALARALAHQPDVLLLDEPFGALDAKIRVQLRQNLRTIQRQLKVTTILVTHDQDEAFELADRIGIVERGQLTDIGVPSDLYRTPRTRHTATFLGDANLIDGKYFHRAGRRSEIDIGYTRLPLVYDPELRTGQQVEIVLRPEELDIAPTAEQLYSEPIGKATVQSVVFAGSLQRIALKMRAPSTLGTLDALMDANLAFNRGIMPGAEVWVGYKRLHVIGAP